MMQTKPFKIGTRGGDLALIQARETKQLLMDAHGLGDEAFEIIVLSTKADRITDRPLTEIGGKGLFSFELEEKLLDGSLDFAVHCTKDMATKLPDGLHLSTFLEREDVRDAFIGRDAKTIADLPQGAVVGTSSMRRQALLKKIRPDLKIVTYRGLVKTRLKKLNDGEVDATLLAYAGLRRMGISDVATDVMSIEDFLPAPAQGALCIESRIGDTRVDALLAKINHKPTEISIACERAFLTALDGSCRTPIAGYANVSGDQLTFVGMILSDDGTITYDIELHGSINDAAQIGTDAGQALRAQAGADFFHSWG